MRSIRSMAAMVMGAAFAAVVADADILTLPSAHLVNHEATGLSLEGGATLGYIDSFGGRVGLNMGGNIHVFANGGVGEFGDLSSESGEMLGAGLLWRTGLDAPINVGGKLQYSLFSTDHIDLTDISLSAVAGGPITGIDNLRWFGHVGLHRVEADVTFKVFGVDFGVELDGTEIGWGGGIEYLLSESISFYGSYDIINQADNLSLGARWVW